MMANALKPKLIVFDLDYTLWPFWVDTHVTPPFRIHKSGVVDARGKKVIHYPDVPKMLTILKSQGYELGLASRTGCIKEAQDLVRLFQWEKYFTYTQIYPGSKVQHFNKFHSMSNIPYQDMLFFDDEGRNIRDVSQLGVTCILADEGMSHELLHEGLQRFTQNRTN